jgi:hypothetical protein
MVEGYEIHGNSDRQRAARKRVSHLRMRDVQREQGCGGDGGRIAWWKVGAQVTADVVGFRA